ncbi:O-antigen ligase family protein [Phycicoccus sp. 3266]|uniref:O-antigen ligase family protein n=1 Tax=Phycicoccus sp. 3266 TaxID=2817751 RepID=UPI002863F219|nr:O-antigen ligase family protein [Phycicoccus sp. 3266]MDR6864140.1 O-antigen ligase [Phycicoccus sp. 3266]
MAVGNLVHGMWLRDFPKANLTVIALVCLVLLAVLRKRVKKDPRGVGALVLVCLSFCPGFLFPALNASAHDKRTAIVAVVLASLVIAYWSVGGRSIGVGLSSALILGAVFILAGQLLHPAADELALGRRTPDGVNAIGAGRELGVAAICTTWLMLRASKWTLRLSMGALLGCMAVGLVATGSRGPASATVVGCIVLLLASRDLPRVARVALASVAVAVVAYSFIELSSAGSRITTDSDSGRRALLKATLGVASQHPWGIGWGNLYNYLPNYAIDSEQGLKQYPHNLLAESLTEAGLVGVALLVASLIVVFVRARRSQTSDAPLLLALLTAAFAGSMLSSDVIGNQLMWVLIGVSLGTTSWIRHGPARLGSHVVERSPARFIRRFEDRESSAAPQRRRRGPHPRSR